MEKLAEQEKKYIEETWQWLHGHPELGMETFETADFVAKQLTSFGYKVERNVGKCGVLGIWDSGLDGHVFGLRADMDALSYAIDGKGVKDHACGHDAHMTMLLTAAKIAKEKKLVKRGKLVLVFQPGEETSEGAKAMAESGSLDDLEEIVAMHIASHTDLKLGEVSPASWSGGSGTLTVDFTGKQSHASRPHLGVNATEIASLAIQAVNCIHADPMVTHSCKATVFKADEYSDNTLPEHARVIWDSRAQTNTVLDDLQIRMMKLIRSVAEGLDAECCMQYKYCPAAALSEDTIKMCRKVIEEEGLAVAPDDYGTASEDFHFFSKILGAKTGYLLLGAEATPQLHIYGMKFRHEAMVSGADLYLRMIEERLGQTT